MSLFGQTRGRRASHNHSYIPYGRPWTLVRPLGHLLLRWVRSLPTDKPLQLSLPDESFNFLDQVVVVNCVVTVIMVETAVLVFRPLIRISLQLAKKGQGSFIYDLHQDLVNRGSQ